MFFKNLISHTFTISPKHSKISSIEFTISPKHSLISLIIYYHDGTLDNIYGNYTVKDFK
jgi:hypothetical protein